MKNKSLKHTFIVLISLTIIIILGAGTFIYYYFDYKKNIKIFESNIHKMVENTYPVYQNYLWVLDYDNLKRLSNSILITNPFLCELIIRDEFNTVIFKKSKKNIFCNNENLIELNKKIFYEKKYIGEVRFLLSKSYLKKNFEKLFIVNFLFSLLLSLMVLLIIIFIFNRFLNKPLSEIINNLRKVTKGEYNIKFNKIGFKEFDEIIANLNLMLNEIKTREKKNLELTERLNALINNIPEGFLIFDKDGHFIDINDSFAKMLKMDKKEVLSKNVNEFSSKKFTLEQGFEKLNNIKNYGYDEFEWEIVTSEAEIIPVFVKGKNIKLGNDNLIIFSVTDISYIKELEKELVTKEKLESLGLLAGGIAHDFNNILTSISGGIEISQLLMKNGKYDKVKQNLTRVLKSIERAKFLTHQLLTFSKGGAPVKKAFFDLKDLIRDTVSFILSGSSITVEYDFDEELQPVKIDPDQISLVIQNIVLNAKQALEGKGSIEVKAVNDLDYVKISIKDYGKGIPQEIIDKIWQPYFTTKESGNGLGLSIVYSIIKNHNGKVKVFSEIGKFTEFQIFIPTLTNTERESVESQNSIEILDMNRLNVLVMDDDKDLQEILKELIELLGHKVDIAENGEQAIEMFKNKKYDLIFLDLTVVGGMGGKECIVKLREIDENVRAVVYSGYSNDPVMTNYRKYGFINVLKKPFTVDSLKKVIADSLK